MFRLELTHDEAIVLLEFLSRFSDEKLLRIDDQAEERVLWDICCKLEAWVPEVFDADYDGVLQAARAAVRDPSGDVTG